MNTPIHVLDMDYGNEVFILADTNILMYRFFPDRYPKKWMIEYANVFKQLRRHGNTLLVDAFVVSEVVNLAMRNAWRDCMYDDPTLPYYTYKEFRDSKDGIAAMAKILSVVNNDILEQCATTEDAFSKADLKSLCKVDKLDFVDKIILMICTKHGYMLITNDGDFVGENITVISSNKVYFETAAANNAVQKVQTQQQTTTV
jgi:predicted nucleic acid-binding protein